MILKHHGAGKIVAAICAAPAAVLAPTGVLEGRRATGFPGTEGGFSKGTTFLRDRVVEDGHLVTSRAMGTALEFSLVLAEKLAGKAAADKIREAVLA